MNTIEELRPLTALRLLTIRQEVCAQTEDELERGALCNAQVLAECCFCGGQPAFRDSREVLEQLTFGEMEGLLRHWKDGKNVKPAAVNPQFNEARFTCLRER